MKNVTDVLADLQRVLLTEGLFERWTNQTGHLRAEAHAKAEESAALRQRHATLKPRTEARIRVIAYEVDKAIAESRDSEVAGLRAEIVEITKNLADLLAQADACDERMGALREKQRQIARRIFEEAFPEIRKPLVAAQQALCDLLDGVWDDLERYQSETGLQGSVQPYRRGLLIPELRADLTARDRGPEGTLYQRLVGWFSPGRR
jgi:chromosome segregation ATPase